MNIIVCIKQVPETSDARYDPVTNTLIRTGLPSIINPFDENALEEAIRLRELYGGTVTAISMGPKQAIEALRDCLAMGADDAILLSDLAFAGSDTWATSHTLAAAISKTGRFDIVICGKQAIDGDTSQVGPGIAEQLGIPHVTCVRKLSLSGMSAVVERVVEDGHDVIETMLPALFTVVKDINTPRLPGIRGKLASRKAIIRVLGMADLGLKPEDCGLKGSPTFVKKTFAPVPRKRGQTLNGNTAEMVAVVLDLLKARHLV